MACSSGSPRTRKQWLEHKKEAGASTLPGLNRFGPGMTFSDFNIAVARALRRGDQAEDGNRFVTASAQKAREVLLDRLLLDAQDINLLSKDITTKTAASYLHRMWNRQKVISGKDSKGRTFADVLAPWVRQRLQGYEIKQEEVYLGKTIIEADKRIDQVNKKLADLEKLGKTEADRAKTRGRLLEELRKAEVKRLDAIGRSRPAGGPVALAKLARVLTGYDGDGKAKISDIARDWGETVKAERKTSGQGEEKQRETAGALDADGSRCSQEGFATGGGPESDRRDKQDAAGPDQGRRQALVRR